MDGGDDCGGTFLHVFVVAGGEGVEGTGEAREETVHLAGFAAEEFECVGVLWEDGSVAVRRVDR